MSHSLDTSPRSTSGRDRSEHLRRAATHLETVFESVDLEHEPRLADAVSEALRATDRAYEVDFELAERPTTDGAESFVYPSSKSD